MTGVATQLAFPGVDQPTLRRRRPTIQERFEEFHRANPQIYRQLVRRARALKARGRAVGIGCLWEVVRYFDELRVERDEQWKLNNNLRSRYARLIMEREPDLADFFDVRDLRSA